MSTQLGDTAKHYPIGTPGQAWGDKDKLHWLQAQSIKRSYADEVLAKLGKVSAAFTKTQYGAIQGADGNSAYPLFVFTSKAWDTNKPVVLVTGGVHGYETSGVQGAIDFLLNTLDVKTSRYSGFNFIVAPCVSPWGYETINRWNTKAVDPNRSFYENGPSQEANLLMAFVASLQTEVYAHFDLHETTDTDNSEFRPALGARDGIEMKDWGIPDGFYTVADTSNPQLGFQQAIIESVKQVTHIAPADNENKIIGADVISEGVICYDKTSLHLCGGFTDASFVTTTEVYPDSPSASADICIKAQVAAITGGLDYLLEQPA